MKPTHNRWFHQQSRRKLIERQRSKLQPIPERLTRVWLDDKIPHNKVAEDKKPTLDSQQSRRKIIERQHPKLQTIPERLTRVWLDDKIPHKGATYHQQARRNLTLTPLPTLMESSPNQSDDPAKTEALQLHFSGWLNQDLSLVTTRSLHEETWSEDKRPLNNEKSFHQQARRSLASVTELPTIGEHPNLGVPLEQLLRNVAQAGTEEDADAIGAHKESQLDANKENAFHNQNENAFHNQNDLTVEVKLSRSPARKQQRGWQDASRSPVKGCRSPRSSVHHVRSISQSLSRSHLPVHVRSVSL